MPSRHDGQYTSREERVALKPACAPYPDGQMQLPLLHPSEKPFGPDSAIGSIEIDYPKRSSWTSGTDSWVIYWFAVSMVAALCCRRFLNVNV